jgi:hypothetical protein
VDIAQYLGDWAWSGVTALPQPGSLVSAILSEFDKPREVTFTILQIIDSQQQTAEYAHYIAKDTYENTPFHDAACNNSSPEPPQTRKVAR